MLLGSSKFTIACTFLATGFIPSLDTQYLRYSSSDFPKDKFLALICSLALLDGELSCRSVSSCRRGSGDVVIVATRTIGIGRTAGPLKEAPERLDGAVNVYVVWL